MPTAIVDHDERLFAFEADAGMAEGQHVDSWPLFTS
jgi:hypothetical protein